MNKNLLHTVGYPRSGNNFLNYALQLMYYPDELVKPSSHLRLDLEDKFRVFSPFRHPLDCISSWDTYKETQDIEKDLDYDIHNYLSFYSYVAHWKHVIPLDFDIFTTDLSYLQSEVFKVLEILPVQQVTIEEVKEAMMSSGKDMNLPQEPKDSVVDTKAVLETHPKFQECLDLYAKLKGITTPR